ncbi:MAG: SUMF1/EgtB/PvdO family nonheme iron enzyme, partial [Gammaproteobacteria bacterium]|nr:SUMF1/EgtB/PvdO family nonheme iron enzyme [Gammaproteobacteria bacterium]
MPKKILILSANPKTTPYLRLDEELREIQSGLERSRKRDEFQIIARWAVRPSDLRRALLDFEPEIVHFSGHGESGEGLSLENNAGEVQAVSTQALARLFKLFDGKTRCILLNACYSAEQAEQLRGYSDYVIGMNQAIGDDAALRFATGFYDALGAGRDYADAFEFGRAAIDLEGIPEVAVPVILTREQKTDAPDLSEPGEESRPEAPQRVQQCELAENLTARLHAIMDNSRLAGQVKPQDEFTRHGNDSLRLIQEAVSLLKNLPDSAKYNHVLVMTGSVLSSAGNIEEAEKLFQKALDKAENDYERALAGFNLFQVRLRRKAWDEALVCLNDAIKLDPRRYALHDSEKYPVERILGAGGMGCVFLCRHRLQRKSVAVKCFWQNKQGRPEKVFREAFLMSDIAGQYVPEPLDYGYADPVKQQRAFFVSEYIKDAADGEAWLKLHGKLSLDNGLHVALQIALGLQAAHRAGIYHHDLKPANLLLKRITSPEGTVSVEVKIIDFGLARVGESLADRALSVQHSRAAGLSMLGQDIFGTFDYAPPEQQGLKEFGEPGAKSDVFSFGATVYRLLTNENPRLPRERALPESAELRELILDCLEQPQEKRPELGGVLQTLQKILAQRKVKHAQQMPSVNNGGSERLQHKAEKTEAVRHQAEAEKSAREQTEAKRKAEKAEAKLSGEEEKRDKPRQPKTLRAIAAVVLLLIGAGIYFSGVLIPQKPEVPPEIADIREVVPPRDSIPVPPETTAEEKAEQERQVQQEAERKAAEEKAEAAAAKAKQERQAQQEAERKAAEEEAEAAAKAEQKRLAQQEAKRKAAEEKAKYLSQAQNALRDNDIVKAEKYSARLRDLDPDARELDILQRDIAAKKQALDKRQQLEKLLAQCRTHLNADRLTTGRGGTALECYRQALADDPENEQARAGLQAIQEKYAGWAENALGRKQWDKVKKHLERMAQVDETSDIFKQTRAALRDALVAHTRTVLRGENWDAAENGLRRLAALDGEDARLAELREEADRKMQEARRKEEERVRRLAEEEAQRKAKEELASSSKLAGSTWTEPAADIIFVKIPGGCFQMGSPKSEEGRDDGYEKQHRVCVEDFWLAKTEVTNAQYRKFKRDHNSKEYEGHSLNGAKQPAVDVSWQDAMEFIDWLNRQGNGKYRLPTEAEWEYAARAGTKTA